MNNFVKLFFVCLSAILLFGCTEVKLPEPDHAGNSPANVSATKEKEIVEIADESSGQKVRKKFVDANGNMTRLEVGFVDNTVSTVYFDGKSKVDKFKEIYADGTSTEWQFANNKLASLKHYRRDKSVEYFKEEFPDDSLKTTYYWENSGAVYSERLRKSKNAFALTFFEKDGKTIRAKLTTNEKNELNLVVYAQGKLEYEERDQEHKSDGEDATIFSTVYRADGTKAYRQGWDEVGGVKGATVPDNFGDLAWVELYDAEGKNVVKKLTFKADESYIDEPSMYLDSMKVVLVEYKDKKSYFRDDGTLEKEEFLDNEGNVTATNEHSADENIVEEFEPEWIRQYWSDNMREILPKFFADENEEAVPQSHIRQFFDK